MSVQRNQYLMWGVKKPYEFAKEWEAANKKDDPDFDGFYNHFEKFIDDSAFDSKITEVDGIFCLFDGMNGKYIVIGKVLAKSSDHEPITYEPMKIKKPKK